MSLLILEDGTAHGASEEGRTSRLADLNYERNFRNVNTSRSNISSNETGDSALQDAQHSEQMHPTRQASSR